MVAVGPVVGRRGRSRLVVWFDPSGLPVQASLDQYHATDDELTSTVVIPCEPFDTLPEIYGHVVAVSSTQLELPL